MLDISIKVLKEFIDKHPQSKSSLEAWWNEAKAANWQNSQQIKEQYAIASFVGNNRVVFNIGGNKYRLVAEIQYRVGIVWVKFIGTHTEYDKINVETINEY